jgi:hypothetical protein
MTRVQILTHEFVEYVPEELKDGVVYVSIPYATVIHKCCCGCGREVVTPLAPAQWSVTFDGKSISLYPSIGNWNLPCKSHYWIKQNRVLWAAQWSEQQIAAAQRQDAAAVAHQFAVEQRSDQRTEPVVAARPTKRKEGRISRFVKWLLGK